MKNKDFVKVSELLPEAWDRITNRVKNKDIRKLFEEYKNENVKLWKKNLS